ncbi:MAG: hypothetical protein QOJ39_2399, partial [Candidatus Eremiobacteraeota bacterium]|nr:hypothetical protein [Candidatus Eremiobacteraeota bacterium]
AAGSYAPAEEIAPDEQYDVDLGSAGPLVVDGANRVLAGGKTGIFYVVDGALNRVQRVVAGVNHHDGNADTDRYQTWNLGPHFHGSPTFWRAGADTGYVYEWAEKDYLKKYLFDVKQGTFVSSDPAKPWVAIEKDVLAGPCDKVLCLNAMPGGMLALSAEGTKPGTGIVWAILRAYDSSSADSLYAFDADTLALLWKAPIGTVPHFAGPTVADGHVFVPTNSSPFRFTIFSLDQRVAANRIAPSRMLTWPRSPATAKRFAMSGAMTMGAARSVVSDYAADPAYRTRLTLPGVMSHVPAGTIAGAAYGVDGVMVYDCTGDRNRPCTEKRAEVRHVYRYDDRPQTLSADEIPLAHPCSFEPKPGTATAAWQDEPQWELLDNACPAAFGGAAQILRRKPVFDADLQRSRRGTQRVPFHAVYLTLVPGRK